MSLKLGNVFLRPSPPLTLRHISLHEKSDQTVYQNRVQLSIVFGVRSTGNARGSDGCVQGAMGRLIHIRFLLALKSRSA